MNKRYLTLVSRVREELSEIKKTIERAHAGWERYRQTGDEAKIAPLVTELLETYNRVKGELEKFLSFLETRAEKNMSG